MRVCDRCKLPKDGLHERVTQCGCHGCPSANRTDEVCLECCAVLESATASIVAGGVATAGSAWLQVQALFEIRPDEWLTATELASRTGVPVETIRSHLYHGHRSGVVKRLRKGYQRIFEWQLRPPETSEVATDSPPSKMPTTGRAGGRTQS